MGLFESLSSTDHIDNTIKQDQNKQSLILQQTKEEKNTLAEVQINLESLKTEIGMAEIGNNTITLSSQEYSEFGIDKNKVEENALLQKSLQTNIALLQSIFTKYKMDTSKFEGFNIQELAKKMLKEMMYLPLKASLSIASQVNSTTLTLNTKSFKVDTILEQYIYSLDAKLASYSLSRGKVRQGSLIDDIQTSDEKVKEMVLGEEKGLFDTFGNDEDGALRRKSLEAAMPLMSNHFAVLKNTISSMMGSVDSWTGFFDAAGKKGTGPFDGLAKVFFSIAGPLIEKFSSDQGTSFAGFKGFLNSISGMFDAIISKDEIKILTNGYNKNMSIEKTIILNGNNLKDVNDSIPLFVSQSPQDCINHHFNMNALYTSIDQQYEGFFRYDQKYLTHIAIQENYHESTEDQTEQKVIFDKDHKIRVMNTDQKFMTNENKQELFTSYISRQTQQLLTQEPKSLQSSIQTPEQLREYYTASYIKGRNTSIQLEEDRNSIRKAIENKPITPNKEPERVLS